MKKYVQYYLIVVLFGFLAPTLSLAKPTITEHKVNGYRVLLINQHKGNRVKVSVNVPTGSWHDDPTYHAGLAHLWEHVIHRGSEKFPDGEKAWADIASRSGGESNAYTATAVTRYFSVGHPEALEDFIAYIGGMMSAPTWDVAAFEAEKKVVMNEALAYQAQSQRALDAGLLQVLLPKDHPLAMYDIGSQAQLAAIEIGDLQDLFYANYKPENMTIFVAGNFDSEVNGVAPLSEENVLSLIASNFLPPKDPRPQFHRPDLYQVSAVKKIYPPLLAADQKNRFMEIKSSANDRLLRLSFDLDGNAIDKKPEAFEMLNDFLNLSVPGSLKDSLIKDGLIVGMTVYSQQLNNLQTGSIGFSLTQKGAQNYSEIIHRVFATLQDLKTNQIAVDVLEFLRQMNINSYSKSLSSADGSVDVIADHLKDFAEPNQILDLENRFGRISASDLQEMAYLVYDPSTISQTMLVGYIGPDVQIPDATQTVPVIGLPYKFRSDLENESWGSKSNFQSKPHLPPITLQISDVLDRADQRLKTKTIEPNFVTHLQESHQDDQGAIIVSFSLPPGPANSRGAKNLFVHAFLERFKPEFHQFFSLGLDVSLVGTQVGMDLRVQGNSGAAQDTMIWIIKELKKFVPSASEIQRGKESAKTELEQKNKGFSAHQTFELVHSLTNSYRVGKNKIVEVTDALTLEEVEARSARLLNRADVQIYLLGNFTPKGRNHLAEAIRETIPNRLTDTQRLRLRNSELSVSTSFRFVSQLPPNKNENEYGRVRVYKGVQPFTLDHLALHVFSEVIGNSIFHLNRATKGLGYVHNASLVVRKDRVDLAFVGETSDSARWAEIEDGWQELIDKTNDGNIPENEIHSVITGVIRRLQLEPSSFLQQLKTTALNNDILGNIRGQDRLRNLIQRLTIQDVFRVARKVLNQNRIDIEAVRDHQKVCEGFLTSIPYAHRKLKKAN